MMIQSIKFPTNSISNKIANTFNTFNASNTFNAFNRFDNNSYNTSNDVDVDSDDGGIIPMDISEDDKPGKLFHWTDFTDAQLQSSTITPTDAHPQEFIHSNFTNPLDRINNMSDSEFLTELDKHIGSKPDLVQQDSNNYEYEDGVIITQIDPPEVIQRRRKVKGKRRGQSRFNT
jgi:hypothetical protein